MKFFEISVDFPINVLSFFLFIVYNNGAWTIFVQLYF